MDADLDTLCTIIYCTADDLLDDDQTSLSSPDEETLDKFRSWRLRLPVGHELDPIVQPCARTSPTSGSSSASAPRASRT